MVTEETWFISCGTHHVLRFERRSANSSFMLLLFTSIHNKLFTFVRRLFTYVYSVNCYDWERERARDEANKYGVLWTMPLVLPLVFFFSDSSILLLSFFCSGLSSLSLSLSRFRSSVFFLLRLCLFTCVSFLICCSKGESRGAGILGGKASARALAGQCFPLSVSVFPLLTLRSSFTGSFFFCCFVLLFLLVLPFVFCVYRSLLMFFVSTLCLSPVLVFVRPLFIPGVLSVFFPFVFVLRSCLGNGMHHGGEKDVTTICCHFHWIGMKEMNSLLWNGADLSWSGHSSI